MFLRLWEKYKVPFLLSVIVFVTIWPVSFYIYLPKWDNIDCYLPYKYFWSSQVWSGEWPWWNPYQYFGLPAYSDMQNGLFNPITWAIVAVFGPYTNYALATEFTLYFLIATLGMWRASSLYSTNLYTRIFIAISFGLSGFMIGTSQILIFIMGAAWLPWIWFELLTLFKNLKLKNALLLGVFISLHVTSASPAYSIILVYLIVGYVVYQFVKKQNQIIKKLSRLTLAAVVSVLTALPFIIGFLDFKPYFGRLGKLPYDSWIYEGSFDWWEYVSFVFPFATISSSEIWGPTDLTLRDGYFGIFGLICLVFAIINYKKSTTVKIKLFVLCVLFLILAAGDYTFFYRWFYELPGFGTFRHPSFFRAFFLFFATILAGLGFDSLINKPITFKRYLTTTTIAIAVILVITLRKTGFTNLQLLFYDVITFTEKPEYSTSTFIALNALILLLILVGAIFKKITPRFIIILVIADLFLHAQLMAPNTIGSPDFKQNSLANLFDTLPTEINQTPNKTPLKDVNENIVTFDGTPIWRNKGTFTKTITANGHNATQFNNFNTLENNSGLKNLCLNPLFFSGTHITKTAELATEPNTIWGENAEQYQNLSQAVIISQAQIGANQFNVSIENKSDSVGLVVINQNYHHNWTVNIGGQTIAPIIINDGVMGVEIPPLFNGTIQLNFTAPTIRFSLYISFAVWLCLIVILIGIKRKETQLYAKN